MGAEEKQHRCQGKTEHLNTSSQSSKAVTAREEGTKDAWILLPHD
jgi:hypothetical protein